MQAPHRIHSEWSGVFRTSTSILHTFAHLLHPTHLLFSTLIVNAEKGYLIKQRINGTERADPFAKRPVKQNAQDDNGNQNKTFEGKELS